MSSNPDSILDSVKKVLGLDSDYTEFDLDVIMHINSTFMTLQQLAVGPKTGFAIVDNTLLWSDYTDNLNLLGAVRSYLYLSVRMLFDPPATSFTIEAFQKQKLEFEWRLNVMAETIEPPTQPIPIPIDPESVWEDLLRRTQFTPKVVVVPFASALTFNADLGSVFYLELTGDCLLSPPINGEDGQHITLQLKSNGFAVTWLSGWDFGTAGEPVLSNDNKTDVISAVYRRSANEWYAGYSSGF
jgi:hypothetical protein